MSDSLTGIDYFSEVMWQIKNAVDRKKASFARLQDVNRIGRFNPKEFW